MGEDFPEVGSTSTPECGATGNSSLKVKRSYPDKVISPSLTRFQSSGANMFSRRDSIFSRRTSANEYNSGEESPSAFQRIRSEGNTPDSCRSIRFFSNTPNALSHDLDRKSPLSRRSCNQSSCDTTSNENRPPSPRPDGPVQAYLERNRQIKMWEDWMIIKNQSSTDSEVASISYRRVGSGVLIPSPLPKSPLPDSSDESESD